MGTVCDTMPGVTLHPIALRAIALDSSPFFPLASHSSDSFRPVRSALVHCIRMANPFGIHAGSILSVS
jgi:hypothetical protein